MKNDGGVVTANICDEVGTTVSAKEMTMYPYNVSMNNRVLLVADHRNVYVNIFNSMNRKVNSDTYHADLSKSTTGIEMMFDICDSSLNPSKAKSNYVFKNDVPKPRITATCVTDHLILIAKEDNEVVFFSYPNITRLNQVFLQTNIPKSILANCDKTTYCFTDQDNSLHFYDINGNSDSTIALRPKANEPKICNAWAIKWSIDNPSKCVVLTESKIHEIAFLQQPLVYERLTPHNYVHLIKYSNVEVELVNVIEIMKEPYSRPSIIKIVSRQMEDAETELNNNQSAVNTILSVEPPQNDKDLLKVLGSYALKTQDFPTAIRAFVELDDYLGISFTEKISSQEVSILREAEVLSFNGFLKKAEQKYLIANRYDLAIRMYIDAGDLKSAINLFDKDKVEGTTGREISLIIADYLFQNGNFVDASKVSFEKRKGVTFVSVVYMILMNSN